MRDMKILSLFTTLLFLISCSTSEVAKAPTSSAEKEEQKKIREQKNAELNKKIESIIQENNLPAVHALILERDETVYQKFQGVRAIEKNISTAEQDRFYLGKNSKIITSVLIAQLIDLKVLNWESTLGELVGKDFSVNPQLRSVTLEMLLAQRSGLVGLDKLKVMATLDKYSTRRARELVVQSLLSYNPEFTPGAKTDTSSANHVVLGWILEKYTNFQWEELVKNKIFYDVGLTACSFGLAANPKSEAVDQPLGHTLSKLKVVSAKSMDLPAAIAPAESLSCSAADFAKLLKEINLGLYSSSTLLREETFLKVFGPSQDPKMTYAHFQVHDRVWAGGRTLTSSSIDPLFTSHAVLAPAREIVILVMVNSGTPKAREGAAKILKLMTESVQ